MAIKKKKRPSDLNILAATLVKEATNQTPAKSKPEKNLAAVALGRLGGLKGGKARAAKLTPKQRREIAKKAAQSRWSKKKS